MSSHGGPSRRHRRTEMLTPATTRLGLADTVPRARSRTQHLEEGHEWLPG